MSRCKGERRLRFQSEIWGRGGFTCSVTYTDTEHRSLNLCTANILYNEDTTAQPERGHGGASSRILSLWQH